MPAELFNWLSIAFGVIGTVFGIYQIRAMRTQRELFREKYSTRYRDVSETVSNLTEHLIDACEIIKADCLGKSKHCNVLAANISATMSLSRELIRFCRRLDEEYRAEFDTHIDPKIAKHLDDIKCRCTDTPRFHYPDNGGTFVEVSGGEVEEGKD